MKILIIYTILGGIGLGFLLMRLVRDCKILGIFLVRICLLMFCLRIILICNLRLMANSSSKKVRFSRSISRTILNSKNFYNIFKK